MCKINDNRDPHHHDHDHPNLVEGDRLQFTSEGKGGVAPLFIRILDALDENADDDDKDDDIYIMMKCVFVCLSRKMSTSSWEALVIT